MRKRLARFEQARRDLEEKLRHQQQLLELEPAAQAETPSALTTVEPLEWVRLRS
jgi:hypothetical protein